MSHIPQDTLQQLKQKLLESKAKLLEVRKDVDAENPIHDEDRVDDNASPDTDAREELQIFRSEVVGTEVGDMLARIDAALAYRGWERNPSRTSPCGPNCCNARSVISVFFRLFFLHSLFFLLISLRNMHSLPRRS